TWAVPKWTSAIWLLLALLDNSGSLHTGLLQAVSDDSFRLGIHPLTNFCQLLWRHNPTRSGHQPRHLRHLHLLPTPLPGSAARIQFDARPTHGHTTRINLHKTATGFQRDFGTGFDHDFLAGFNMQLGTRITEPRGAGFEMKGAGYVEAVVFASLFALFAVYGVMAVAFAVAEAVVFPRQVPVVLDDFGAVVLGE